MDSDTKLSFLKFAYFTSERERVGLPLFLIARVDDIRPSLSLYEAPGWRSKVEHQDMAYLESFVRSVLRADQDASVLFDELEQMSIGPIRVIDNGHLLQQDLSVFLSAFPWQLAE